MEPFLSYWMGEYRLVVGLRYCTRDISRRPRVVFYFFVYLYIIQVFYVQDIVYRSEYGG